MIGRAKTFLILGAAFAALAVAIGAFGAHGLRERLAPEAIALYQTGVQYHFWHALGLLAVGLVCRQTAAPGGWLAAAGWLLAAGIVLFSGSLYALALGAPRATGMVTPLGGIAFIGGWVALAMGVVRAGRGEEKRPSMD